MRSFMLQPEPWLFLIELKVKNYDNWQPCLTNHYFSLQSVVKKSFYNIYRYIDYIYSYNALAKTKHLQTIKQLSSLCICRIPRKKNRRRCVDQNVGHSNVVARTSPSTVACVEQWGKPGESNGENQWERTPGKPIGFAVGAVEEIAF